MCIRTHSFHSILSYLPSPSSLHWNLKFIPSSSTPSTCRIESILLQRKAFSDTYGDCLSNVEKSLSRTYNRQCLFWRTNKKSGRREGEPCARETVAAWFCAVPKAHEWIFPRVSAREGLSYVNESETKFYHAVFDHLGRGSNTTSNLYVCTVNVIYYFPKPELYYLHRFPSRKLMVNRR